MSALPAAFILFAQAVSATAADSSHPTYGPAAAPAPKATAPVQSTTNQCPAPATTDPKAAPIIVCAIKPQGYRIDPDVLAARRMKKKGDPGAPKNPHETDADHSCSALGPIGCRGGQTFNIVGAAMAAANVIDKAVKDENVGQALATDPSHSEYQLYKEAKREREEKEAEKAAKAVSDAAKAKAAADAAKAKTSADSTKPSPQE